MSDAADGNAAPSVSLPPSGGAMRGIGEKFSVNPVTGTAALSVSLPISSARSGFAPRLSVEYDSSSGNGPFGIGWRLSLSSITRKTQRGLPRYDDGDTFLLSGADDLVPKLAQDSGGVWQPVGGLRDGYRVDEFRPRTESTLARIERWSRLTDGDVHWRMLGRDNVVTVYGADASSRVADPDAPGRVFSWLASESYDSVGNAIVYDYFAEDAANVDFSRAGEAARVRTANRYLERVRYGNRQPLGVDATAASFRGPHVPRPDFDAIDWMFELVLDYGQGLYAAAAPDADGRVFVTAQIAAPSGSTWPVRADSFSSYRAGFEVRTQRLCRGALMFHHFADELGTADCLVRATQLAYDERATGSRLTSVTEHGYRRFADGRFLERSLPTLTLGYSESPLTDPAYDGSSAAIDQGSLAGLPNGVDERSWRWVDLDGEGIVGALELEPEAWYYKRNLGEGQFEPAAAVPARPSYGRTNAGPGLQLLDLGGDGTQDLVDLAPGVAGFFARDASAGSWENFRAFLSWPVRPWDDNNVRLVDLSGDGLADLLLTSDDALVYHPSLGEDGFGPGVRIDLDADEDRAPRVVFADGTQTIVLADLTGDGLFDIVRVRNGEVSYWPSLGYGRFGARIAMDNAPWFDAPELFDATRLRLADTDGNGVTDLIYLGRDAIRIYLNEVGNGWSDARVLSSLPTVDNARSIAAIDLLGRGTACLCWSSPLPGDAAVPMRYVDLMDGVKPNLLVSITNAGGGETTIDYAASTQFYLADRAAGTPWVTRLPFPVQVVASVETLDHIGRNRFVTRYTYHHGYFDGIDREFHGFGRVEQLDTEEMGALTTSGDLPAGDNFDATSHVPPALVKLWFHTGAYGELPIISRQLASEYYDEGGSDAQRAAMQLSDSVLPGGLTAEECRAASRALTGSPLRREVYALDGSSAATRPYLVEESNYALRQLQPMTTAHDGVFTVQPRESLRLGYERALFDVSSTMRPDPRALHTIALENDDWGNLLTSASIVYGRRFPDLDPLLTDDDRAEQARTRVTLTAHGATALISLDDAWRTPVTCESRVFELYGVAPASTVAGTTNLFRFAEMTTLVAQASDGAHDLDYADNAGAGATGAVPWRRLIDHARTIYRANDLTAALPLGQLESLALVLERQKLALPASRAQALFVGSGKLTAADLDSTLVAAGYIHSEGDGDWWAPSRQLFYSPTDGDPAAAELAWALQHFFVPHRYRDPFGSVSFIAYDGYTLLPQETRDPLGNVTTAGERAADGTLAQPGNDYRVLKPVLVTDPNRNRAAVAVDALGEVIATAVMGKSESPLGDSLAGIDPDPPDALVAAHLSDPLTNPEALLGQATQRLILDRLAFARTGTQPMVRYAMARESHVVDGPTTGITHALSYFDGLGREIQTKMHAPDGPLSDGGPTVVRWIASGWTILDNKGAAVRVYQPFFDASPAFVFGVLVGQSPITFYDPLGRTVGVLYPNHTWEKIRSDPWRRELWDVNDTVLVADPSTDADLGDYFARLPSTDWQPTWYAARAGGALGSAEADAAAATAIHAATPSIVLLDALGRAFLTREQNAINYGSGPTTTEYYRARLSYDIEGNQLAIVDALERTTLTGEYDLLGGRLHAATMDAGDRWLLPDVAGNPVCNWDARGHAITTAYDAARRPITRTVRGSDPTASDPRTLGQDVVFEKLVYGEGQSGDVASNLRGRIYQRSDGAGVQTAQAYDVQGNAVQVTQALTSDYKALANWSAAQPLDPAHTTVSSFDALNRLTTLTTPDASVMRLGYDEAGHMNGIGVNVRGASSATAFVSGVDYDARGERTRISYGSGAASAYAYEPLLQRLMAITTTRPAGATSTLNLPLADSATIQALAFTYDPAGNITQVADAALTPVIYNGAQLSPIFPLRYDARYRLIVAAGREQTSQAVMNSAPSDGNFRDYPFAGASALGDPLSQRNYTERYTYDGAGNLASLAHQVTGGGWTRAYTYAEASLLEPAKTSNRLSATSVGAAESYQYDAHGAITRMPHLPVMQWSFKQELFAASRQVAGSPEMTYFIYDADGHRLRKVTERANGTRVSDRVYLAGWELYREYGADGTTVTLTRECLHVFDGAKRVATVETDTDAGGAALATATRYPMANQVGSSCLELDETAALLSYEEYSPFGTSVFQAGAAADVGRKRYRYTARERDQETGFAIHGLRYYMPWLGRWACCDPAGIVPADNPTYHVSCKQLDQASRKDPLSPTVSRWDAQDPILWQRPKPSADEPGHLPIESAPAWNLYVYAGDNPIVFVDTNGLEAESCRAPGGFHLDNSEKWVMLLGALFIIGSAIFFWWYLKQQNHGGDWAMWVGAVLGGMGVVLVVALSILGAQQLGIVHPGEGQVTDLQEARVFDLWSFFHYLVPAIIGAWGTLIFHALSKKFGWNLSGTALFALGTATAMVAAVGWEVLERHFPPGEPDRLKKLGAGEYPSNIIGDAVLGTFGGAIAAAAFVFALGLKIPPGVVFLVGAAFVGAAFTITATLIAVNAIRPTWGTDTWPYNRAPIPCRPAM